MALSVATVGGRTATDTASDNHSCVAFLKSARIVPILDSSLSPPFVSHLLPLVAAVTLDVLDCERLERPCNGRGSSHLLHWSGTSANRIFRAREGKRKNGAKIIFGPPSL